MPAPSFPAGTRVETVCLDLDGTLVDALAGWRAAFALTWPQLIEGAPSLAGLGAAGSDQVYDHHVRPAMHEAWSADGEGEWADAYVLAGFRTLLQRHAQPDAALAEAAAAHYLAAANEQTQLYPDAGALLDWLSPRYPLGLISNGLGRDQRAKAARCGLTARFEVIVISEEVDLRKPDPAIFHYALERLGGADPATSLYVGDNVEHDVAGARSAGMHAVWLNRSGAPYAGQPIPDIEIATLAELPGLLDAAGRAG